MKRRHGKSWHTLYKEKLLEVEEINRHLRTLQQKYIGQKEQNIDIDVGYRKALESQQSEHTKAILLMRLSHEAQLKEIKIELDALRIELQRVKVKDDIARTTEGLIAQCVRILADYAQGKKLGDEEAAPIGKALDELKTSYHREEALRKQAVENALRRVGHPGNATDLNRAMYGLGGLGGAPLGNVHITGMGKWPEAGMSGEQPTGDPQNKVGIGKVPKVDIHVREDEPEQKSGPSQRRTSPKLMPRSAQSYPWTPDPKGS